MDIMLFVLGASSKVTVLLQTKKLKSCYTNKIIKNEKICDN